MLSPSNVTLALFHSLSLSFSFTNSLSFSPPLQTQVNSQRTRRTKLPCFSKSGQQRMANSNLYLDYHGLLLPKIAHTEESLNYLQNFQVKDDDVIAVTYPKSGKIILCFRCILFFSPHAFSNTDLLHYIFLTLL